MNGADLRVQVLPGDGLVAKKGAGTLVALPGGSPEHLDAILGAFTDACATEAFPGRLLARRLTSQLAMSDPDEVPPFGLVARTGEGWVLFLHGAVRAQVLGDGTDQRFSGLEAATWVDRLLDGAWTRVALGRDIGFATADERLHLEDGVVPGGGVLLEHARAAVEPFPERTPEEYAAEPHESPATHAWEPAAFTAPAAPAASRFAPTTAMESAARELPATPILPPPAARPIRPPMPQAWRLMVPPADHEPDPPTSPRGAPGEGAAAVRPDTTAVAEPEAAWPDTAVAEPEAAWPDTAAAEPGATEPGAAEPGAADAGATEPGTEVAFAEPAALGREDTWGEAAPEGAPQVRGRRRWSAAPSWFDREDHLANGTSEPEPPPPWRRTAEHDADRAPEPAGEAQLRAVPRSLERPWNPAAEPDALPEAEYDAIRAPEGTDPRGVDPERIEPEGTHTESTHLEGTHPEGGDPRGGDLLEPGEGEEILPADGEPGAPDGATAADLTAPGEPSIGPQPGDPRYVAPGQGHGTGGPDVVGATGGDGGDDGPGVEDADPDGAPAPGPRRREEPAAATTPSPAGEYALNGALEPAPPSVWARDESFAEEPGRPSDATGLLGPASALPSIQAGSDGMLKPPLAPHTVVRTLDLPEEEHLLRVPPALPEPSRHGDGDEPADRDGEGAFESVPLVDGDSDGGDPRSPLPVEGGEHGSAAEEPGRVLVEGVRCERGHFNHPKAQHCARCGATMAAGGEPTTGPRPSLGVLLLDDGTTFTLDADYVLGREPELDTGVQNGHVRPLRLVDPQRSVSRVHATIDLEDWTVYVVDRGSANGTHVAPRGAREWTRLQEHLPHPLTPGTRVAVGQRILTFNTHHQVAD